MAMTQQNIKNTTLLHKQRLPLVLGMVNLNHLLDNQHPQPTSHLFCDWQLLDTPTPTFGGAGLSQGFMKPPLTGSAQLMDHST